MHGIMRKNACKLFFSTPYYDKIRRKAGIECKYTEKRKKYEVIVYGMCRI